MDRKEQLERVRTAFRSLVNIGETLPQVYMSLDCMMNHFGYCMDDNDRNDFLAMRQSVEAAKRILQPLIKHLTEKED